MRALSAVQTPKGMSFFISLGGQREFSVLLVPTENNGTAPTFERDVANYFSRVLTFQIQTASSLNISILFLILRAVTG